MARIIGTIDIDFDISCNVTPELYRKILKGMQREVASLNSGIDDIFYDLYIDVETMHSVGLDELTYVNEE